MVEIRKANFFSLLQDRFSKAIEPTRNGKFTAWKNALQMAKNTRLQSDPIDKIHIFFLYYRRKIDKYIKNQVICKKIY